MKIIGWLFVLAAIVMASLLLCRSGRQGGNPPDQLLPGETHSTTYRQAIITSIRDNTCSESLDVAAPRPDGYVSADFTVQKDTTYALTLIYFNGDTLNPSCRLAGRILADTTILAQNVTACPTGGPWVTYVRLTPGQTYTLILSLMRCPQLPECRCGEILWADAVVSIRPLPALW